MSRLVWIALIFFACAPKKEVVIVVGGDVMLDRSIRTTINTKGLGYLFEDVRPVFRQADFTVINLECPATSIRAPLTKQFVFRAEPEWLHGLKDAGVTHCILANNHSYDQGRDGLISTAGNLQDAGLVPVGYGTTQREACQPVVVEKDGMEVAIFSSVTLALESWMYLEDSPGMCQATVEDLKQAIALHKKEHPNRFILITLHWGIEYRSMPTPIQRDQATALVDAGADAIIGHHPHVIQSYESIHGKPVFYSVGNLVFDNPNPKTHEGLLVKLALTENTTSVEVIPYRSEKGKPVLLNEDEKRKLLKKLDEVSDPMP